MKIIRGKFMMTLLILAMSLTLISPMAHAEEAVSGEIPVKISLTGTPPEVDESYKIVMKAGNTAFPMPAGSEEGIYTMTIVGANTDKLPKMEFSSIGVYSYEIWQEKGNNELGEYDTTKYNLVVYVTNDKNMEGLETTVLLYKYEGSTKFDEVEFENYYDDTIIEVDDEEDIDDEDDTIIEVEDEEDIDKGLPKTGSSSNIIYILIGAVLLIIGIASLVRKKITK